MRIRRTLESIGSRLRLLPSLICILTAIFVFIDTSYLIVHYFNPLFYGDAWVTVNGYQRLVDGQYELSDLFSQHNEHRLAVARLVFLADFVFGRGLNIINQSAIFLIQLLHALLLVRIAASILSGPRVAMAVGVIFVLLFSYGQADNFNWGFQVQFVAVYAAATLAFWWMARALASDGRPRLALLALSYLMALVSTYCMSNGFIAAFVLVALAAASRASVKVILLTALFAIGTAALYFRGFSLQSHHSPPGFIIHHPLAFFQYMFAYLGGPMGGFGKDTAILLGITGALLAAIAAVRAITYREPPARVALIGVMIFVLVTAAATAFGRAFFGIDQALESRYLTPVCVFWASQFIYWASVRPPGLPRAAMSLLSFFTLLVMIGVVQAHEAMRSARLWAYRQQNIATDLILSSVQRPDLLATNYPPPPEQLDVFVRFLAQQRLNIFALPVAAARGRSIEALGAARDDNACIGAYAARPRTDEVPGTAVAGWGWDNLTKKPVEHVLITDAGDHVVGFASGGWFWYRPNAKNDPQVRSVDVGWLGFANAVTDKSAAFALLDGGRVVCRLPHSEPPAGFDGKNPTRTDLSKLGAPIEVVRALRGGWASHGYPTRDVPVVVGEGSGSWVDGVGVKGSVSMGPFVAPSRRFGLPLITGSDTSDVSIEIDDAETGQIYAFVRPKPTLQWDAMEFDIPRNIAGRHLIVKGISSAGGADKWLALGDPHAIGP